MIFKVSDIFCEIDPSNLDFTESIIQDSIQIDLFWKESSSLI